MVQTNFFLDPNTASGVSLASQLNAFKDSIYSTHLGDTEPKYRTEGMLWYNGTDLQLYNGSSWQAVNEEAIPSIFKGTFQTGAIYAVGDLTIVGSSMYVCETVPTTTEFTATDWQQLGGGKASYLQTAETPNATYSATVENLILEEGTKIYLRIYLTNTGGANLELNNTIYDILKGENKPLQTGDLKTDSIIELVYNGADFMLVSNILTGFRGYFQAGESYNVGDFVVFENTLFACTTDTTTVDFEVTDWQASGTQGATTGGDGGDGEDGADGADGEISFVSGKDILYSGVGYNDFPKNKIFYTTATVTVPTAVTNFATPETPAFRTGTFFSVDDLGFLYPFSSSNAEAMPDRITTHPNNTWNDLLDASALTEAAANSLILNFTYIEGTPRTQHNPDAWSPDYCITSNSGFPNSSDHVALYSTGYGGVSNPARRIIDTTATNRVSENLMLNPFYSTFNCYGASLGFGEFSENFIHTIALYKIFGLDTVSSVPNGFLVRDDPVTIDTRVNPDTGLVESMSMVLIMKGKFRIEAGILQVMVTSIQQHENKTNTQLRYLSGGEVEVYGTHPIGSPNWTNPRIVRNQVLDLDALIAIDDGLEVSDTHQLGSMQFYVNTDGIEIPGGLHYKDVNNNIFDIS